MDFLIISGLAGAGKSTAADVLEDMGYYCVDNLPAALIKKFAQICMAADDRYQKVALVTDIRDQDGLDELFLALKELTAIGCKYRILYVAADAQTIIKRYKETRRPHPLVGPGLSIEQTIESEQALLSPMREKADFVVSTSQKTLGQLKRELTRIFSAESTKDAMSVSVFSFGFKHGIPIESDLVFDVRFLPNPYYIPELRDLTGLDKPVSEYVFSHGETLQFMDRLEAMVRFLLPLYVEEGKVNLTISIGCTGGHHRSVALAKSLSDSIAKLGYNSQSINRDISK